MSDSIGLDLRGLVAEAVRDVVSQMVRDSVGPALATGERMHSTQGQSVRDPEPVSGPPFPAYAAATGPGSGRTRTETVRITSDADLAGFARHLLELFENPKNRQDLRSGRLRFTLSPTAGSSSPGPTTRTRRVDRGAVTERAIDAAHAAGESLVLARGAVLTPLGRERARALGVYVEKEH